MKTCTKCRVTKTKEEFWPRNGRFKAFVKRYIRTNKGRLCRSYEACKRRHIRLKRESEMMAFARFKAIYEAQGGRCVESGAPFVFDSKDDLFPSPDRIDNNGGYEDRNVRFVSWRVDQLRGAKTSFADHAAGKPVF